MMETTFKWEYEGDMMEKKENMWKDIALVAIGIIQALSILLYFDVRADIKSKVSWDIYARDIQSLNEKMDRMLEMHLQNRNDFNGSIQK